MDISGEWREIPGHPGFFVNEHGTIASANHGRTAILLSEDGKTAQPCGQILLLKRCRQRPDGYLEIGLHTKGGATKNFLVHDLVARTFLGDRRAEGLQISHLDGDPSNCRVSNLQWVTQRENNSHKWLHGTMRAGERHAWAKLTDAQTREIRELYATGKYYQRELGEMFGVTQGAIWHVVSGDRRKHLSGPRTPVGAGPRRRGELLRQPKRSMRPWLADTKVREIRELYATGEWTQDALAKRFGVGRTAIIKITQGKTFKAAGGPIVKFRPGPRKETAA